MRLGVDVQTYYGRMPKEHRELLDEWLVGLLGEPLPEQRVRSFWLEEEGVVAVEKVDVPATKRMHTLVVFIERHPSATPPPFAVDLDALDT